MPKPLSCAGTAGSLHVSLGNTHNFYIGIPKRFDCEVIKTLHYKNLIERLRKSLFLLLGHRYGLVVGVKEHHRFEWLRIIVRGYVRDNSG